MTHLLGLLGVPDSCIQEKMVALHSVAKSLWETRERPKKKLVALNHTYTRNKQQQIEKAYIQKYAEH